MRRHFKLCPILAMCIAMTSAPSVLAQSMTRASVRSLAQASAQTAVQKAVNDLVIREMTEQNLPGYAIAVVKDGNLIVHRGYGFANLQTQQPATPQTVFGLASLTKTFTALTLLTLVDQGKVGLDDTLDNYISHLPKPYQKLTIRQLASMTAGVPKEVTREVEWKNQLPILTAMPLVSDPGTTFLYSNFSYRLLGDVIQKASGKPYFEMVQQGIFNPVQMTSSGTTVSLTPTGLVAQGYGDNLGKSPIREVEYKNPEVSFSAGMLASTVDDLLKYAQALMARQLLSPKAYQTLWYERPPLANGSPAPWAFGWSSKNDPKFGGARVVAMNGGTPGVASSIIMLPEKNCAVVALCNLRKPAVPALARKVAALVFDAAPDAVPQPAREAEPSGE